MIVSVADGCVCGKAKTWRNMARTSLIFSKSRMPVRIRPLTYCTAVRINGIFRQKRLRKTATPDSIHPSQAPQGDDVGNDGDGGEAADEDRLGALGYLNPCSLCFIAIVSAKFSRALKSASDGKPLEKTGSITSTLRLGIIPAKTSTVLAPHP